MGEGTVISADVGLYQPCPPTKLFIGQILIDYAIVLFGIWFATRLRLSLWAIPKAAGPHRPNPGRWTSGPAMPAMGVNQSTPTGGIGPLRQARATIDAALRSDRAW